METIRSDITKQKDSIQRRLAERKKKKEKKQGSKETSKVNLSGEANSKEFVPVLNTEYILNSSDLMKGSDGINSPPIHKKALQTASASPNKIDLAEISAINPNTTIQDSTINQTQLDLIRKLHDS